MRGAITHEESQEATGAFIERGHDFYSCDLVESSGKYPDRHYQQDAIEFINQRYTQLNFYGAHPVCQFLANSGVRWLASKTKKMGFDWSDKYQIYINQDRFDKMTVAALHFKQVLEYVKKVGKGYVENPIIHKYAMEIIEERPTQIIQPYEYGHTEKKATCLWVVGLPILKPTNNVFDEMMKLPYKERAKIHYASPGKDRAKLRSRTYPGIAKAMAEQWGSLI